MFNIVFIYGYFACMLRRTVHHVDVAMVTAAHDQLTFQQLYITRH